MQDKRINDSERRRDLVLVKGEVVVTDALVREAMTSSDALEALCDCYINRIYNYVLKRVGKVHDAEDITSMVFEKVLGNLDSFDSRKASFSTWIYRIATNCMIDFFRSQGRKKESALDDEQKESIQEDEGIEKIDRYIVLTELMANISVKYREALALRYLEGMRVLEVAETLGISESAASKRILRGLEELRKQIPGSVLENML